MSDDQWLNAETVRVATDSVELAVTDAGAGAPLVLLHGWPHTRAIWHRVAPALARSHRLIAPDLRGLGESERPAGGYDAATVSADIVSLLDHVGVERASIMAVDASVPAAVLTALRRPDRVDRLVVMESLLGTLPGAEDFLAAGPPWWFGFHSVPGLAETVLLGHEPDYIDWFLRIGVPHEPIDPVLRAHILNAYTGADALRAGFEYYRALPRTARQLAEATAAARLTVPTLALGAGSVGDALHRQLRPIAKDVVGHVIPDCGHIVPLDGPEALLELVTPFLA
ncbi:alpha/beta fold hydrolase [Nocardia mikamii]|uniref:alpha/beta fold hydrolase n=1 Tax=Nocardia mikamii TaxID=508464 RepID=UPI0007A4E8FA|nr:alpha/beta fold hydrolase [Nocardia mikamii]